MPIINTVEGDLIELAKQGIFDGIAHGCNCFHAMGSGIAPQIAKAFPLAEAADNSTKFGSKGKLGSYSSALVPSDEGYNLKVFNLYTQFSTGVKPYSISYKAIYQAFSALNDNLQTLSSHKFLNTGELYSLGIPMIGAGLGGGHWEAIELLINLATPDIDITLVKYNK